MRIDAAGEFDARARELLLEATDVIDERTPSARNYRNGNGRRLRYEAENGDLGWPRSPGSRTPGAPP